jgi:hypothetical protein
MQAYSDTLGSKDSEFEKIKSLVEEIDTVILAADETKNVMVFHSPKNFGGMRTRPKNKVVGMIGLGAQATWVKINLTSALADCNIIVPTVKELAACTTAQEVAAILAPNVIGLNGFKGSAIFIPAPALRNAILASNTQDPCKLIPLMSETGRAFDAAHANGGNMNSAATNHSDDLNALLFGVKEGVINKTRYSVIPEEGKVAQFYSNPRFQCILIRGLAIGGGMVANNDTVLLQLTAPISAQNEAATESNNLQRNEIHCQLSKDESKKDRTKKIHPSILQMIAHAAALSSNDENKNLPQTYICFVNCDKLAWPNMTLCINLRNKASLMLLLHWAPHKPFSSDSSYTPTQAHPATSQF